MKRTYCLNDIPEFISLASELGLSMNKYMPDSVSKFLNACNDKNPLSNPLYKHMKLNRLTEAENTLSPPTTLTKELLEEPSEYIEIEDGFIHDARQFSFVHNIRLLDVANKKVFKKYQEYFQPTGSVSDLCFLNCTAPVGIKTLANKKEQLNLHFGFTKEKTRNNFTDISSNVVIIDIGKRNNVTINEEFYPNSGVKVYKILYLIREGSTVTINRSVYGGTQSIDCQFIQFPNSDVFLETWGARESSDYTQEFNNFDVWDNCRTIVNGKYVLDKDYANNIICKVHHKGPNSLSKVDVKTTLEDNSHLSFLGEIIVDKSAVNTDASLTNKNLQLSKTATVVTEPKLDIHTKEIACSHGCTVSNVDKNQLYALQSRGMSLPHARRVLKECFLDLIL